ncbi:DUF2971 domain-containing protein [Klebsiella quasipneumoniae]|nr:DUF2971 domain-containing protein [Klebsiella quasipneumoniae]EIY5465579.1 DUF2971 domain-containing protein [Klebsiella quasipneumoniae]
MSIFHYTDLNGLKGIIEGNSLWATNIHFLNDKNEYVHGYRCFRNTIEYLDDVINGVPIKKLLIQAMNNHVHTHNNLEDFKSNNVYSISFCRGNDQLSQWRGYASLQGVCIEFDEDALIQGIDSDGLSFLHNDVMYTNESSTVEVTDKINKLFETISQSTTGLDDSFLSYMRINYLIESNIPFFKNLGFSEEKEFRFVFSPSFMFSEVNFRVGAYGLIPFLDIKMKENSKLPIKKIIIGPSKDRELLEMGINLFLQKNGYAGIPVDFSSVPYRS